MTGLMETISTAIALTARLSELADNIEDQEFKHLLAKLSLELADLSLGLAQAELRIANLIVENAKMRDEYPKQSNSEGELCPKCRQMTFELISSKPHPAFGDLGYRERRYKCSDCGFAESSIVS